MALVRWDPFPELDDVAARLGRLANWPTRKSDEEMVGLFSTWTPAIDVEETDKEYLIKADLPDMKKEDVKINLEDGMLVIEGERQHEKEEKGKKFHRVERSYGKFVRRLTVPTDVEQGKVAADYKDGVLAVHLPKMPVAKPKTTEIKVN